MNFAKNWHEQYDVPYEVIYGDVTIEEWESQKESNSLNEIKILDRYLKDIHIKKLNDISLERRKKIIPIFLDFLCSML